MKYRRKPTTLEAIQWTGENLEEVTSFGTKDPGTDVEIRMVKPNAFNKDKLSVQTNSGYAEALPGDWILKGPLGEFYPCKPDIFAATYEAE